MGLVEAALFERGAWTKALEKYAAVTHLTVQLYDTDERPTCGPVHPTALFDLFTPGRHDLGIFAACIRRCLTQADMPPAVVVEDHNGLAVVGTALTLGGEIVGVAVAGYALTAFLDQHTLERLARNSGRSFETVWAAGRQERHVPRERLTVYGELLRTLGDTLLAESFSTRQQEETAARLAEALQIAEAARATAEATQETLRDREERLRATFSQAAVGFSTTSLAGRFLDVNQAVCDVTGYSREELLRLSSPEITHPDDREQNLVLIRRLLDGEVPSFSLEERYICKDGEPVWANLTVSAVRAASGEPLYLVGIIENINDRRRVEAERARLLASEQAARDAARDGRAAAEAANRAKDEFLATLSHELRSPLGAILTWAHLLRSGSLDARKTAHALETIERSAKAQKRLIEDLLDVSCVVAGKLRLEVQPVDLAEVIEGALDVVRPAAEAKSVELESVLPGFRHGRVLGDPGRLQQVVCNLLANAIKFTPNGGHVAVRLEVVDSRAEIAVSDTGKGISADFLPHIFERFRQADSTTTRAHSGLGLGLAIVSHLVELHGGTVRAESRGEGQGTTFRVTLPLLSPELTHWEPVSPPASCEVPYDWQPVLEGVRVLVVDDEADVREWLTAVLAQCRAEVTTAASVGEGLEALERVRPDVLMSDIGMPGEDGYALIRKVRTLDSERGGEVPALALTGYASAEDRVRALAAGYQVHMSKPVDPAALVEAVTKLVVTAHPRLPAARLA